MNNLKNYLGLSTLAIGLCLLSCNGDHTPSYSQTTMKNSELRTILQQKGYQFNEQGSLLLDDLANNTTALDLSGTKLSDLSGLDILPNLAEVKLSDNGYGPVFDFSKLPQQITGIDLTDNDIYDYDNLVNVVAEENGDETVTNLHNITKLYLPRTAKDNLDNLVPFYIKNKDAVTSGTIDMKIQDESGTLRTYTTLRSVPDEGLRTYLQANFSDLFNGDQIDLSKHLGYAQGTEILAILPNTGVTNFEGIQYIIGSSSWMGSMIYVPAAEKSANMPLIKVGKYVNYLTLENLSIESLDLSEAESLFQVTLKTVSGLRQLDLSSTFWGQREKNEEAGSNIFGSVLDVYDCPSLKEIKLPKKGELKAYQIDIECLDALETLDMSDLKMVQTLKFGDLPENFNLVYPELTVFYSQNARWPGTYFGCSESTFNRESTQGFLDKYYTKKSAGVEKLGKRSLACNKNKDFNWVKALTAKKP